MRPRLVWDLGKLSEKAVKEDTDSAQVQSTRKAGSPKKTEKKRFSCQELVQIFAIKFLSKDMLGFLFSGELLIEVLMMQTGANS